ncbi:hypothetical protein BJF88_14060 [Cellulosimicrobium sp. CUA-896]|nr:hypothetical protein BJF88_14060 [Cellulosimicrobium sp. CUA-896]
MRAPATSTRRSSGPISSTSPSTRRLATCACSWRLATTTCEPSGTPRSTMPSASWHASESASCRSSTNRTNGSGVRARAAARSGADRPSTVGPVPRISPATAATCGDTVEHASASSESSAPGSSSSGSTVAQATARSSVRAHSASVVVLPYPGGAVTATTRAPLVRARSTSARRLTAPRRARGAWTLPASSAVLRSGRVAVDVRSPWGTSAA